MKSLGRVFGEACLQWLPGRRILWFVLRIEERAGNPTLMEASGIGHGGLLGCLAKDRVTDYDLKGPQD